MFIGVWRPLPLVGIWVLDRYGLAEHESTGKGGFGGPASAGGVRTGWVRLLPVYGGVTNGKESSSGAGSPKGKQGRT